MFFRRFQGSLEARQTLFKGDWQCCPTLRWALALVQKVQQRGGNKSSMNCAKPVAAVAQDW